MAFLRVYRAGRQCSGREWILIYIVAIVYKSLQFCHTFLRGISLIPCIRIWKSTELGPGLRADIHSEGSVSVVQISACVQLIVTLKCPVTLLLVNEVHSAHATVCQSHGCHQVWFVREENIQPRAQVEVVREGLLFLASWQDGTPVFIFR